MTPMSSDGLGPMALLLLALLWALLVLPSGSLLQEEFDALEAFRKAIKEDPFGYLTSWDIRHSGPCGWFGVTCSDSQDHVVRLKLFNCSLSGTLSPRIGSLGFLQELTLGGNLIRGPIPQEIGSLKRVIMLDLSSNNLSGSIPPEIGGLGNISKIYLSSNQLTGSLPSELGNLANLEELQIDGNKLSGVIPGTNYSRFSHNLVDSHTNATGLCLLTQLKVGDFSFNFFTGEIPPCLGYLPRSSFRGNCFLDRNLIFPRATKQCEMLTPGSFGSSEVANLTNQNGKNWFKHKRLQQPYWLLILETVTGALLVVLTVVCLVTVSRARGMDCSLAAPWKRIAISKNASVGSTVTKVPKLVLKLNRQELEVACEDFSNIIGSAYSNVYKGTMKDGAEIAVVSLCASENDWSSSQELQFQHEVSNLARLDHENVVRLLGYCEEREPFTKMLVFEYESNGTLSEYLHYGGECQLSWSRRMRIVIGVARGLRYMHTELQPCFTLSDLHSSTVYLTEEFSAKLADFESWKAVLLMSERFRCMIGQRALCGHRESLEEKHNDIQANTFAFGVLLLEIISGRPPFCKYKGCLLDWAAEFLEKPDMIQNLVDPGLKYFNRYHLQTICNVIRLSIEPDPSKRPSMEILTAMLESGINISLSQTLEGSPLAWAELELPS